MNPTIYRYPLDPTGKSTDNLVEGEEHQLSNRAIRVVAPKYQGFYATGVIVIDAVTNVALDHGPDYYFGELYEVPTGLYEQEIFGLIVIKKPGVTKVKITYQCLGGNYSYSMDAIIAMLDNLNLGERPVAWGDIIGKPKLFDPASHLHDLGDVYGFEYVVNSLERIRSAILLGDAASHDEIYRYVDRTAVELNATIAGVRTDLTSHTSNTNNPHNTTKAQVGLSNVNNFAMASIAEMDAGAESNRYTSPALVNRFVSRAIEPLNNHVNNTANPHNTTKAQVGLGSVENYPVATMDDMSSQTPPNNRYVTPFLVNSRINDVQAPVIAHINNTNNPHNTTAAQVGLGSVVNYPVATQAQLAAGTGGLYTTADTVNNYVRSYSAPFSDHLGRADNPHQVTKAQVGLGNVENFGIASYQNMVDATGGAYLTSNTVNPYIQNVILTPFSNHVNDFGNPHRVTKTQVGLGSVENYPVANATNMQNGNGGAYLTPDVVKPYIDTYVMTPLNNHVSRSDNPHNTTAAQVGLGNVNNWGAVTTGVEVEGALATGYVTPRAVHEFVSKWAIAPLSNHAGNTANPHQVTKAQVGLGSVENYPVANAANMQNGNGGAYLTPDIAKAYIDAYAIGPLNNHVARGDNPHNTTKAQVGLGNVPNYPAATQDQLNAGVGGTFATSDIVKAYVDVFAIAPAQQHANRTDNPHNVTKAQLGLGNVENFGIATTGEMDAGSINNKLTTPSLVNRFVTNNAVIPLNNHVARTDNPHGTTAAQVGLGNVQNYPIASDGQATAGTADNVYMTPYRVKQWTDATAFNYFLGWSASFEEAYEATRYDRWMSPAVTTAAIVNRLANYYTKADVEYLINTAVANSMETYTYGTDVPVYQWTTAQGVINNAANYFDVFPPQGKTMSNIIVFIASNSFTQFNGAVDDNDTFRCQYTFQADRIRVWCGNSEQRSAPRANWIAVWR